MSYPTARIFSVLGIGLAVATLGMSAPAFAQPADPQIKVEFGDPVNGVRRGFSIDQHGVSTEGRLRLGPDGLRLDVKDEGHATVLRTEDGRIDGLAVGISASTRITVRSEGCDADQISQILHEEIAREIFRSSMSAEAKITRRGASASVGGSLGVAPTETRSFKLPLGLNLGLFSIKVVPSGSTTEGGASTRGEMTFDVSWSEGSMTLGAGAGANLPRFLGGRGVDGSMLVQIQLNPAIVKAVKRASDRVKAALKRIPARLKRAGRSIRDRVRRFRASVGRAFARLGRRSHTEEDNSSADQELAQAVETAPAQETESEAAPSQDTQGLVGAFSDEPTSQNEEQTSQTETAQSSN